MFDGREHHYPVIKPARHLHRRGVVGQQHGRCFEQGKELAKTELVAQVDASLGARDRDKSGVVACQVRGTLADECDRKPGRGEAVDHLLPVLEREGFALPAFARVHRDQWGSPTSPREVGLPHLLS